MPETTPTANAITPQEAERRKRFNRLAQSIEDYNCRECVGHDQTRPGASRDGRYAVHAMGDEGRSELTRCNGRERAQIVAESHMDQGWQVQALYDLDTLAGEPPTIDEGDEVEYAPGDVVYRFTVDHVEEELIEGEVGRYLCLIENGRTSDSYDDYDHRVHECDVTVVERGEPDERLPVKYDVAGVVRQVIFNTVAS